MPRKAPNKQWNDPKKVAARQSTVVDAYRAWSGLHSLPADLHYWTLGGDCVDKETQSPIRLGEYDHVLRDGLIVPRQWVCVEGDPVVSRRNATLAKQGGTWLDGEFVNMFKRHCLELPPGIVNFDTLNFYGRGVRSLGDILLLADIGQPCFVVMNVLRSHQVYHHVPFSDEEILALMYGERCFDQAMRDGGWRIGDNFYSYDGTGRSAATMNSWIFVNRPAVS